MSLAVLLSRPAGNSRPNLRQEIAEAGFTVVDHTLGSAPAVDFGTTLVAVIEVGERADLALGQTRRWRAEQGDDIVPIVWILDEQSPAAAVQAFDAGADAVLVRPLRAEVVSAQIRSSARLRRAASRVAARADETRLLGEQLQRAYTQIECEQAAAQRIHRAVLPQTLPSFENCRFTVTHRQRCRVGGDFFDVRPLDKQRVGFYLGDVIGTGSAGSLIGVFVALFMVLKKSEAAGERVISPGEVLTRINQEMLRFGFEERPLIALLYATLDLESHEIAIARAGLPAPIYLPIAAQPQPLTIPGPFLGTADATYPTVVRQLQRGDRLILASDGTRSEGGPGPAEDSSLLESINHHRGKTGQAFVDALGQDLLTRIQHADDFSLLCLDLPK